MALEGHGERRLNGIANHDLGEFGKQLAAKGFKTNSLNLAVAQEVPANASMLLIANPQVDLQPAEVQKIKQYLQKGGNLLMADRPRAIARFAAGRRTARPDAGTRHRGRPRCDEVQCLAHRGDRGELRPPRHHRQFPAQHGIPVRAPDRRHRRRRLARNAPDRSRAARLGRDGQARRQNRIRQGARPAGAGQYRGRAGAQRQRPRAARRRRRQWQLPRQYLSSATAATSILASTWSTGSPATTR